MNSEEDVNEPVKQRLKVVSVMDCVPGESSTGEPITILTLAHDGAIEEPLMVSFGDTKKLVVDLLVSLAEHGNDFAIHLLEEYFLDPEDEEENDEEFENEDEDGDDGEGWKKG